VCSYCLRPTERSVKDQEFTVAARWIPCLKHTNSRVWAQVLQIVQMNLMVPFATHNRLRALECEQRETVILERSLTQAGLVDIRQADLMFALEL